MWIATKRRCCMCSTQIASESRKPPALLIRGGGRIIIDCRRRIYWNRSTVEENTARGDRHGNREAKKPKKLKPKESGLISTLASIQASVTAHKSAGRERSPGLARPFSVGPRWAAEHTRPLPFQDRRQPGVAA